MRRIHVLMRKEEIDSAKLTNCTAVIIDVLLATTTIAAVLHRGAKDVIPALDEEEALAIAESLDCQSYVLAGEKDGFPLEGFTDPDPRELERTDLRGKTLILCTTNGTVAIKGSSAAKRVYASSFFNASAVAEQIREDGEKGSVLIVCSGSRGSFSIEDFLGAGYLISELLKEDPANFDLSDSAQAAFRLHEYLSEQMEQTLRNSATGILLEELGYNEVVRYAAEKRMLSVVPRLEADSLVMREMEYYASSVRLRAISGKSC